MGKKRRIKELEAQVAALEARLDDNEPQQVNPHKKGAKNSINVYFDSNFLNSISANERRRGRGGRGDVEYDVKGKPIKKSGARRFFRFLWKFILTLLVIALILIVVAAIVMLVVWALVNFGVTTQDANTFVRMVWEWLKWFFNLFGMEVPLFN